MKRMFLLFSHKLTEAQRRDAIDSHRVDKIVYLPDKLQKNWSQVDSVEEQWERLEEIWNFVKKKGKRGDYVLIQGEWGWVYHSVNYFKGEGMIPLYSSTKREVVEIVHDNTRVEKQSLFEHARYKSY